MNKKDFDNFFKPYAKNVDNANEQGFWKLSDALIMKIIKKNISTKISKEAHILDAGGGTGRWVCQLSKFYKAQFIIYDLSRDMLNKAKENIHNANINNRVKLIEGDLTNMTKIRSKSVDYILSIYSPISFIYKKMKAFKELFRILKPGGKMLIMGHGFYNALASKINNYNADKVELEDLVGNHLVKWADYVPKLNIFSKEMLERDLRQVGFQIEKTYGVPVFVQPGVEDFDKNNVKKSKISEALARSDFFSKVIDLEMKFNSNLTIVNRGMNIFTVAIKK